jgi:CheY-like chemotaxis protein
MIPGVQKLRALVVHPEPAIAALVRSVAESLGFTVTVLPDGERAIDRFVLEPFDVVVVEYFLPGRDGVTTVESIRWAPQGRQMRAVLLAETEPEIAPLAALGARIDAVDTLVGTPTTEGLLRALERARTPAGQLPTSPATKTPPAASFDDETVVPAAVAPGPSGPGAAPSKTMATRFDDESTVQGSAGVARAMLGALPSAESRLPSLLQSSPDAAPRHVPTFGSSSGQLPAIAPARSSDVPRVTRGPSSAEDGEAEDGTRVARPTRDEPATSEWGAKTPASAGLDEAGQREWRRDAGTMAEAKKVREEDDRAEGGGLSLSGRFETTPFPALLATLADARTSGGLICKQEAEGSRGLRETTNGDAPTKIVYFRSGVPTHVRSNLLDECLGQLLLRRKRIGRATLEESIRRTQAGDGLQGEILIDMGALSPIEVSETLSAQASEKLYDLFGWRRGSWRLASNVEPPRDGMGIELGLPEIVYEGVCAAMPATLLLDLLTPHLAHFVVPDAARLARFTRVRLPNELRPVLAKIDGRVPLRVLLGAGSRPGAVAQMVYALECLRAVQFEEQPRGRGATKEESDIGPAPARPGGRAPGLLTQKPQAGADWEEDATSKERPKSRPVSPLETGAFDKGRRQDEGEIPRAPVRFEEVATSKEGASRDGAPWTKRPAQAGQSAVMPTPEGTAQPAPQSAVISAPAPETPSMAEQAKPAKAGAELDQRVDRLFEAERHFRRGNRALERQRWDEALSAFVRAHELVPTEGEFLAYVGWSRFSQPEPDEGARELALTELAQAADLSPDLYVTHLLHARVLTRLRRDGEARRAYERVLALEPNNEEAQTALARPSRPG